jgi:Na+-translocating ferredoxin:NAD+ oxidoreductase RNF subunit RnfB
MSQFAYKLLPVIGDACTGCGLCVHACDNHCLELVWDFATLQHPHHCASDGKCAAACPRSVIQMQWVKATGDASVGLWRKTLPEPAAPANGSKGWLSAIFAGSS